MTLRLLLAIAVAGAVVLSGPFVSEINVSLQNAFPGQHLRIIVAIVVAPALIGIAVAFARIRERRTWRYAALIAALVLAGVYVAVMQPIYTEQFHLTEYAVITFLFYRVWRSRSDATTIALPVVAALMAGLADEWFQWFIPSRVGELRDVVLNGVGIAAGLLFALALNPPNRMMWLAEEGSRRALAIGSSALIVGVAVFLQSVHLGYTIEDPAIGRFPSHFDAARLRALAADRSRRWQLQAPATMPRISREDHYLAEALFHVQRRNEAIVEGDHWSAWQENLILEKFYSPVLLLASLGYQWPPQQRAEIEAAVTAAAPRRHRGSYVSDAYPFPIYTWNRGWFWGTAAAMLAAIAAMATGRTPRAPQAASV